MNRPANSVKFFDSQAGYEAALDVHQAYGYTLRPYREGTLASKPYKGRIWIYIVLGLLTYGLGAIAYGVYCGMSKKGERIYIRLNPSPVEVANVPDWVRDAMRRHRDQGVDYGGR